MVVSLCQSGGGLANSVWLTLPLSHCQLGWAPDPVAVAG